jgi:hypothetical protein
LLININGVGTVLWGAQAATVGLTAGYALARYPAALPTTRFARFLIGLSAFPAALGLWVLLVGFLLPRQSPLLFAYGPAVVCLVLLAYWLQADGCRVLKEIGGELIEEAQSFRDQPLPQFAAAVSLILLIGVGGYVLGPEVSKPTLAADAVQYLNEAMHIVRHRDSTDLSLFRGTDDGSLRGDIHSPIWPLYLSNALMADFGGLGFPNDEPSRLAFLACNITVFTALAAVVIGLRLRWWLIPLTLALSLTAMLPEYGFAVAYRSRDSLRLAALVIFVAVLLFLVRALAGRERVSPVAVAVLAVAAAYVSAAHTLGSIVGPVIVGAWVVASLWSGAEPRNVALIALMAMLGLAGGSCTMLAALFFTGSLTGDNITADSVLVGTQYMEIFRTLHRERVPDGFSALHGWLAVISLQTRVILLLGTAVAVVACTIGVFLRIKGKWADFPNAAALLFLSLNLIGATSINAGVFDLSGVAISTWFAMNPRYGLHVYVLGTILVSAVVGWLLERRAIATCARDKGALVPADDKDGSSRRQKLATALGPTTLLATALVGVATFCAVRNMTSSWTANFSQVFDTLRTIRLAMPSKECKQLTEVDQTIYYLPNPAVNLYSKQNGHLFLIDSPDKIVSDLDRRGICGVLGYSNFYLSRFPADSPLRAALEDSSKFEVQGTENSYIILYARRPAPHVPLKD